MARLRIFNPDGSEAELSGNGAREAVLYLRRRGWTDADAFSIQTAAGEIRADDHLAETTCTRRHGRRRGCSSDDYPTGADDGRGELDRRRAHAGAFSTSRSATRSARSASTSDDELERARPAGDRPGDRAPRAVPEPHQRLVVHARSSPGRIRARIFERGVGETSASGTGATGAAVAYVLDGGDSPVTVVLDGGELEVEVGAGPAHQPDRLGGAGVPRRARR